MIYLDNAASTVVSEKVSFAMQESTIDYANPNGGHSAAKRATTLLESARKTIADSLGVTPLEIVFTSSGTESNNLAIFGSGTHGHIVTSAIEHSSVLEACKELELRGREVTYIDVNEHGVVSVKDINDAIRPDTLLVSVMHANNETGVVQPISAIGKVCAAKGVMFHVDASQSYCKIPIPLENISLLTMSSHKIHGPKGIGALFIRTGIKLSPLFYGGGQELGVRPGTQNVSGIVGFAAAVSDTHKYSTAVRDYFIEQLEHLGGVIHGNTVECLPSIISVGFSGIEAEVLLEHLDVAGIYASAGSACTSHSLEPSHVLLAMNVPMQLALGTVRFSLSKYTTLEEVNQVIHILESILKDLRSITQ